MPRLTVLIAALAAFVPLASAGPGAVRADAGRPLVVVELFTSQGCSSCPPADRLLAELSETADVLPLSLHVDYWDYLGWRDRFARPEYTKRQKAYALHAKERSIYTPQMIVQGGERLVGSDEAEVRAAVRRHVAAPAGVAVVLDPAGDHMTVRVSATAGEIEGGAILHYVTYDSPQTVSIDRGENSGKTMTYVNVVRDWLTLGSWDGTAPRTFTAPVPAMGRGVAVIVQRGSVGPILAAARLEP